MQLLYQGNHIFRFGITRHLDYQTHLQNSLELVFLLEGTCHARCGGLERQMVPGQMMAVGCRLPSLRIYFSSFNSIR